MLVLVCGGGGVRTGRGGGGRSGWVWRFDGTKLEEKVQNLKEKVRKYETKHCFAKKLETLFRETTRNAFFVFFSDSRNDRNLAKQ